MNISKTVAKIRFWYHSNMVDVADVMNQLGIINDDEMEAKKKKHAMIIFNSILPRFGVDLTNPKTKDKDEMAR